MPGRESTYVLIKLQVISLPPCHPVPPYLPPPWTHLPSPCLPPLPPTSLRPATPSNLTRRSPHPLPLQVLLKRLNVLSKPDGLQGLLLVAFTHHYPTHASSPSFSPTPWAAQVLVERFKDEIVASNVLSNPDGLQGLLLGAFQEEDPEGFGQLPQKTVKEVLQKLSYQV